MTQLEQDLEQQANGQPLTPEPLDAPLLSLPLAMAADGVTVPFRPHPKRPEGKIQLREVKVALFARLKTQQSRKGRTFMRLQRRRLVAVLGDIHALYPRLHLEAVRQGIQSAPQVVWLSDGAPGFWRLFEQHLASIAVGILDFYHAAQHLWQAAEAYGTTLPTRTPRQWFKRLRHQLRHGYVHQIIKEFGRLLTYPSTPETAKPTLKQVQQYLKTHQAHLQYRQFKKLGPRLALAWWKAPASG